MVSGCLRSVFSLFLGINCVGKESILLPKRVFGSRRILRGRPRDSEVCAGWARATARCWRGLDSPSLPLCALIAAQVQRAAQVARAGMGRRRQTTSWP